MGAQKLYRSRSDKMISGVCGGLGQYCDIDPTILRLGWVAVTIFSGILPGALVYLIAVIVIPKEPEGEKHLQTTVIEMKGKAKKK
ncbi:PspC domain-containing protein [Candidatus Kaiserbacteria bacterium]|nr:PspC domain-containing protein [Candidatus Kaiserbacteria bacterium]